MSVQTAIEHALLNSPKYGPRCKGYGAFVSGTVKAMARAKGAVDTVRAQLPEVPSLPLEDDGEAIRARAARKSLRELAHTLSRMDRNERWQWLPPVPELVSVLGLSGDDNVVEFHDTMQKVAESIITIAKELEQNQVSRQVITSPPAENKTDTAEGVVVMLAWQWHRHFGEPPRVGSRSPFCRVVNAVLPLADIGVTELSEPSVRKILAERP